MEVVAPVDAIISGFQRSSDLTKRLQALRGKKRTNQDRFLEQELQLALDKARDELTQHKQLFVSECGFTVPREDPYSHQVDQLQQIRTAVEVFHSVLQVYCDNGIPLKDPRKSREDADKWRFTTIQALSELRMRVQISRGQPTFSPTEQPPRSVPVYTASPQAPFSSALPPLPLPSAPPQAQTLTAPIAVPQSTSPPTASAQDTSRSAGRSSQDSHDVAVSTTRSPRSSTHAFVPENTPSRAATWAPDILSPLDNVQSFSPSALPSSPANDRSEFSLPLRVAPLNTSATRPSLGNDERRESTLTFRTTSSSSAEPESANSSSPHRREGFFKFSSSRRKSSLAHTGIERSGDVIRSVPSKKNSWHGFCPATFDILEDVASGLDVVQRPATLHSTKMFLQCKKCAFPGNHHGTKQKDKTPDPTVMTSTKGIRYRWIFLAKSHVKSPESTSGDIKVQDQIARSAYRCVFCYLDGILPDKLGGLETLMNHIWQHHRGRGMNQALLRRTGCIIGRRASSKETFDINIPQYAEEEIDQDKNDITVRTDSLSLAPYATGATRASSQGSTNGDQNEEEHSVSELNGLGPRQDPVELMGSNESYLV